MKRNRKRKISLGLAIAILCTLAIPVVILSLAFFPSPVKQIEANTELRVAYGEKGSAEPHIVRVVALPSGEYAIVEDLGRIE